MSAVNNGGPAFPRDHASEGHNGMDLRDYFAAKALPGLIGRSWSDVNGKIPDDVMDRWAAAAYLTADAMLKARES